jgi:hypothetical protein
VDVDIKPQARKMKPLDKITPELLKSMSDEDRVEVLKVLIGRMDPWAVSCVSYLRWNRRTLIGTTVLNNGSCFFLDFSGRLFLVTAAHVYDRYLEDKEKSGKDNILCHVENIPFEPEARLQGYDRNLDLAIFDFFYDDLIKIGKQTIETTPWPPPEPSTDSAVFFGGFPGNSRFWLGTSTVSFGLYMGHTPITTITDRQITCRFDREAFIPVAGLRTPPPGTDLGGMSGGPLLVPLGTEEGVWHYCLGGVITQAQMSAAFEIVVAVRAHFINPDGTISPI